MKDHFVINPNSELGKYIINTKVRVSKEAREFFTEYAVSPSTKRRIRKLRKIYEKRIIN